MKSWYYILDLCMEVSILYLSPTIWIRIFRYLKLSTNVKAYLLCSCVHYLCPLSSGLRSYICAFSSAAVAGHPEYIYLGVSPILCTLDLSGRERLE